MSELRVDNIVDMGGSGAPQLRKGANVTGISTITQAVVGNATINAGGINATGIVTSSSNKFVGDFASGNITAGVITATSSVVASNITINSGGVSASGIVSATSYQGSGANLTGVGLTIAPLAYNPDVSAVDAGRSTGIGLTFNQRVSAGVGTITLSLVSIGSTVAEVFGLGNTTETTYTVTVQSTDSGNKYLLDGNQQYTPVLYPGGVYTFDQSDSSNSNHPLRFSITDNGTHGGGSEYTTGVETNGTPGSSGAYTRITISTDTPSPLYYYCTQHSGMGANITVGAVVQFNNDADPPNITITPKNSLNADTVYAINYPPGAFTQSGAGGSFVGAGYTFDTQPLQSKLFTWGQGSYGAGGINDRVSRSSPTQVPGTWEHVYHGVQGNLTNFFAKDSGTLWSAGYNSGGQLGQNNRIQYSSPVQIPGTTWSTSAVISRFSPIVPKTDGTLWSWGKNNHGQLGLNQSDNLELSSPTQIPGTTWSSVAGLGNRVLALKTNGTLWSWGYNEVGQCGLNDRTRRSSPTQVPGTTWAKLPVSGQEDANGGSAAIKTDGTLWVWGDQYFYGQLGLNEQGAGSRKSSPVQVPGTTWSNVATGKKTTMATKTDGTLWVMGDNENGALGQNNTTRYSSPVQIPGTNWDGTQMRTPNNAEGMMAMKTDGTLWGWGNNTEGKLGLNNTTNYSSPVQVPGTDWTAIGGGTAVTGLKLL